MTDHLPAPSEEALARTVHEIVDFVDAEGWEQPPMMFALVPTVLLAASEPALSDQLDAGHEYTPILQEAFPDDVGGGSPALDEFLATTSWPESVAGCALVQEIVVLPPSAETDLDEALVPLLADPLAADEAARTAAHRHPDRREGRLIAAVLRDGPAMALLQLRPSDEDDPFAGIELRTYDDLAPNVISALYATLEPGDND
ncbi:PPA1309 family protein [Rhodococcus chondri]|uniref:PPA1309 family protein n=1 Tax=Rhodococcus chondri TaxID=3065941 RepID=A0ABU7JP30_9NOCA|nr:PPA1309 family protein [Rhodococcus sp. CC-R104]MEE2031229.1 PPA1309 family protein [Rhodococcus sp. CC-R104]